MYKCFLLVINDIKEKVVLELDFKIDDKKKSDKKRESLLEKEDKFFELLFLKFKVRNREI